MIFRETILPGVYVIDPEPHGARERSCASWSSIRIPA
jgi:hypothetical protein